MIRPAAPLRRALTALLAVAPLLTGADLCTIGAVTGRTALACGMESGATAAVAAAAASACGSHCAAGAPARETPRPHGPTCCDLRPQADGAAGAPSLVAPEASGHPAMAPIAPAPVVGPQAWSRVAPDAGRAPPSAPASLRAPRAPPLG